MTILILEDEPIIAVDLEEIVSGRASGTVVVAATLRDALRYVRECGGDLDFALLDLQLGRDGSTSLPVAEILMRAKVPFCFVSATTEAIPSEMQSVPQVRKPFEPQEIEAVLPLAA
ncbi:response regulator [Jiella sonneratiae]|uniref:Response regulator n=1 Tax=Jiella sonneratiae TaxID=2816856 RepID=A0ABS3J676_9HYPH|nr:response regulator [Jiella sonneratiae]MBO0905176.1 response regulator [Jiella sonneratiae]